MNQDQTFRLVLIVGALIVLPVMVYHRLRSQATGETLDRWQEGVFILFTLRPIGVAGMVGLILYMINPGWMAWSSVSLPEWLRWAGAGLGVIAAGLLFWTLRNLGKNLTDTVVTRRVHTLVSSGPYRWVRHPFYDAAALCMLANGLAAANWFVLLTGGVAVALLVVRTRTEEEKLILRFGDSYRTYVERTGRFLPRIRPFRHGVVLVVSFVLASGLARGQGSDTSPQERQEILSYQLTLPRANQLIAAMETMTRYVVSLPDFQDRVLKSMNMTPAERRAQLENDPKAMAILKQNGLTAQDYLVGVPTLRMALIAAQGLANNPRIMASPANVAFAKANLNQLKPKLDAADGIGGRR